MNVNRELLPTPSSTPTLAAYAMLVARVGLTSFGGGVSAWMMRLVVQERGWVTEAEFLSGLALCQVFPGINVLNLSIWLGYRLRGSAGAIVGALAMTVPPGIVLIALATAFAGVSHYQGVHTALNGVAAAAVGLVTAMGLRAGRRAADGLIPIALCTVTVVLIGILHWPLVPVVLALAALSVTICVRQA